MKTKLASLALLIPAVVLAQSAPPAAQPPQAGMPPSNTMSGQPANPAKAADALNTAKKQAKELESKLPSNGEVGSGFITSSIGLS